tara:strand:- start:94 stop:1401 length:1308 start_codon:yes stop_codon:yes gene_type:complete
MRNKIGKPIIYTNTTLFLMAKKALTFEWMRRKSLLSYFTSINNSISITESHFGYNNFMVPKIYNSKPSDFCFINGNKINTMLDDRYPHYVQGIPFYLENENSSINYSKFWDTIIIANHNLGRFLKTTGATFAVRPIDDTTNNYPEETGQLAPEFLDTQTITLSNAINLPNSSSSNGTLYDGFSLANVNHTLSDTSHTNLTGFVLDLGFPSSDVLEGSTGEGRKVFPFFYMGSTFCAKEFTFPRAGDLEMEISYSYEGITRSKSIGGSTNINQNYNGRNNWGPLMPFEISKYVDTDTLFANQLNTKTSTSGCRKFKLNFSYLEDKNSFNTWSSYNAPSTNSSLTEDYNLGSNNNQNSNLTASTLFGGLDDGSIYEGFINRTLGGSLPFIMCLDSEDKANGHNPENWAVCMLNQDSITFEKVSNDFYNVSLEIDEIW